MMEMLDENREKKRHTLFKQVTNFVLVGGIAFLIDFGTMYVLFHYAHIPLLLSNTVAFVVSLLFNYWGSKKCVFQMEDGVLASFAIISVIGLGINNLSMMLFVEGLTMDYRVSKVAATVICMIYNFIAKKIYYERPEKGQDGRKDVREI